MAGCQGLFGKGVMFDESIRVPLLVRQPEKNARVVDDPVSTVDLFSTILHIAGVEMQADAEGHSLLPCLNGEPYKSTDVFIEYKDDCIVRGDVKLITKRDEDNVTSCFNISDDPYELNNLVESLDSATCCSLLGALNVWRDRTRR